MLLGLTSFNNLSNWGESSVKKVLTPISSEETTSSKVFSTYFSLPVEVFEKLLGQKQEDKEKPHQTKEKTKIKRKLK